MDIKGKYLKDESGDIISPITSGDTVFKGSVSLVDYLKYGMHSIIYEGSASSWKTTYQLDSSINYALFLIICYVVYNREGNQITSISGASVVPYSTNTLPITCDWNYDGNSFYVRDAFKINQNNFTLNWQSDRHLSNAGGYDGGLLIYKIFGFLDYNLIWSYI